MRQFASIPMLVAHLAKRMRCNAVIYRVLRKRIFHKNIPVSKSLESYWPDRGESSLCINEVSVNPKYDLQIVVPAYNVAKYVEQCVDSILVQKTKYSFCVVIVNDGSTDDTPRILDKYRNLPDITVIDQVNRGLSGARNTGMKYIDARYVMFVDSDDYLSEYAVERLMDRAVSADSDVVEGSYARVDETSSLSEHIMSDSIDNRGVSGFAWGKVYRAGLFEKVHYPEGYWFEDTIGYQIVFPMARRISTISDIVYYWRKNAVSITAMSKGNIRAVDAFWVIKKVLADRNLIGLPFDEYNLEIFLYQVRTNFNRVSSLCNREIDKALFNETCELYNQYYKSVPFDGLDNEDLALALYNRSYKGYRLFCLYH